MWLFRRRGRDLFRLPEPALPAGPFRMVVADVFVIAGRGVVATGTIEAGTMAAGGQVTIERGGTVIRATEVGGVERVGGRGRPPVAGQAVGLLLRGVDRDDVAVGDLIRSP